MLLVVVTLVAVAVLVWQVVHRSSPLVRRWHRSSFPRRSADPLSVLDSGPTHREDHRVVVLLHGMGTTGDYFGAFYDGLSRRHRVVIVDLLGFGHSLDEDREDFGIDDHVDALETALVTLGLGDRPIVIAAHSMSAAIALTWADRHRDRTEHVYLWGPPVYPSEAAAHDMAKQYGTMGRLFALDTRWAERACRLNCTNRRISGQVMALLAPRWPTELSSEASQHTWPAYHLSLSHLVLDFDWAAVLPAHVPLTVFHGADDPIGDQDYLARCATGAEIVVVPDADHHIALQRPDLLFDALEQ